MCGSYGSLKKAASKAVPIRITAHPRGAFISVGDWTPTETNLLLLTT